MTIARLRAVGSGTATFLFGQCHACSSVATNFVPIPTINQAFIAISILESNTGIQFLVDMADKLLKKGVFTHAAKSRRGH